MRLHLRTVIAIVGIAILAAVGVLVLPVVLGGLLIGLAHRGLKSLIKGPH